MHGLVDELRRRGETPPEVGYPVESTGRTTKAVLELAWPSQTRGVAIAPADIEAARKLGWSVREPKQALDEIAPLDTAAGRTLRSSRVPYEPYRAKAAQSRYSRRAASRSDRKPRR